MAISLLTAGLFFACNSDEETNPYIRINPFEAVQVSNDGAQVEMTVEANIDWTYSTDASWLTIEPVSGGLRITAEPNTGLLQRRALLNIASAEHPIASKTLSIVQGETFLTLKPGVLPRLKADGQTFNVNVETNAGDWQVEVTDGAEWLTAAKSAAGFVLTAKQNNGRTERTGSIKVSSVIYNREILLDVTQNVNFIPYVNVQTAVVFDKNGGAKDIAVDTNIEDLTLASFDLPYWLAAEKTAVGLKLTAAKQYSPARSYTMTVISPTYPEISVDITVSQTGSYTVVSSIFVEDFDWVGNASETANKGVNSENLSTDSPQSEITYWANDFGTDHGWTSTPTLNGTTNRPWVYSRYHHVKMGRANNSADMISPKVTVTGSKTVLVTYRCAAHSASETNYDFTITVTGGGKIVDVIKTGKDNNGVVCFGEVTPQGAHFVIGNKWVTLANGGAVSNWGDEYALRSFVIEGFTSNSQVHFIGDESYQARAVTGNRRYGLDDVSIEEIQ